MLSTLLIVANNSRAGDADPWKKDSELDKLLNGIINQSYLAHPTYVLALMTGAISAFVYRYYAGFCERLSMPYKGLDLPLSFYLSAGFLLVVLILFLASIIFIFTMLTRLQFFDRFKTQGSEDNLLGIIFILSILASFLTVHYPYYIIYPYWDKYLGFFPTSNFYAWLILYVILIILLWLLINLTSIFIFMGVKGSYPHLYKAYLFVNTKFFDDPISGMVGRTGVVCTVLLLSAITFFYVLPYTLGSNSAKSLIEGESGNLEISINPSYENSSIAGGPLILVMYYNGKYYAVKKCNPAPDHADLYIISENDKDLSIIKTIP